MKYLIVKDYNEMSKAAFDIIKSTVISNPGCVLGFATGGTPLGLYKLIVDDHKKNGTSYRQVKSVNLDEYVGLPPTHNQSYAYFMKNALFDHIDILPENTHIPDGLKNADEECARYDRLLMSMPRDVQILGLGSNGHIAFNEPGTPFDSNTHIVGLSESTIKDNSRFFESLNDVPHFAITMGIAGIMQAKKLVVLASGENKAEAVYKTVKGSICREVPASILQKHSDCILICDESAGAKLI